MYNLHLPSLWQQVSTYSFLLCRQSCCLHPIFSKSFLIYKSLLYRFFALSTTWHSITYSHSFYKTASDLNRDIKCSECNRNTTETKTWTNSGFERDSNSRPLRYRCSALPTELSKPHESGRVWVSPLCERNTRTEISNAKAAVTLYYWNKDLKKLRLWMGFEPTTSAIAVQCSPN